MLVHLDPAQLRDRRPGPNEPAPHTTVEHGAPTEQHGAPIEQSGAPVEQPRAAGTAACGRRTSRAGAASPPVECPHGTELERLADEIATLAAHLHAATYRLLELLREFDAREGWGGGFRNCAHWLSWRTGIAPGAAREKVRVARALGRLPRVAESMRRGELSCAKVRAITRVAAPENEEQLLEIARSGTAAHVEKIVRAWRRVDRLEEQSEERERHARRHFTIRVDEDGSYAVRGRLDPEVGAMLLRALEASEAGLFRQPGPPDAEAPTHAQRRADAIGLVAEAALTNGLTAAAGASPALPPPARHGNGDGQRPSALPPNTASRAGRFQVVLHVDAQAIRPAGTSGDAVLDGVRVPAETARRIACDAGRVIMVHDSNGMALDVGRRTRTVPPAIRRALDHRDRDCRFPGCDARFCDAHHIVHWADGGRTRLDNLVLLCRRHHRAVHEEGYRIARSGDGELVFTRPDGQLLPRVPIAPPLSGDAVAVLCAEHRAAGLKIHAMTATPSWMGEPLDLGLALVTLRGRGPQP